MSANHFGLHQCKYLSLHCYFNSPWCDSRYHYTSHQNKYLIYCRYFCNETELSPHVCPAFNQQRGKFYVACICRQVGVFTLGIIGVCLLVAVVCLSRLYCVVRKKLRLATQKAKDSDENVQEQPTDRSNQNLISGVENAQASGSGGIRNLGADASSSESVVVYDKEQVWLNKKHSSPTPSTSTPKTTSQTPRRNPVRECRKDKWCDVICVVTVCLNICAEV